jgi:arylformamidase
MKDIWTPPGGIERWIDISMPVSVGMPVWPGDPPPVLNPVNTEEGFRITEIAFGSHTGTHVDAPAHVEPGGKTLEQIPLDRLIGPCQLIEAPSEAPGFPWSAIKPLLYPGVPRVLFKTSGAHRGHFQLSAEILGALRQAGVVTVGIDTLSIGGWKAHDAWLTGGTNAAIEGLNLDGITPGLYYLVCLPLLLPGLDAAPARAVLGVPGGIGKKT